MPYEAAKHIYIAYSGGMDSHVLLHLCSSIPKIRPQLSAVYINHGLQVEAGDWAEHCAAAASALNIAFQTINVQVVCKTGNSLEEAARIARYQALQALLQTGDVLLVAQHQDDQLETVLLQLFRGCGLPGLSAMPASCQLGKGTLLRPLLGSTRECIEKYARQHDLQWVEDASNQDNAFNRNFLRNAVIPLLKQRWPALQKTVARSAGHCAQAQLLIDGIVSDIFSSVYAPAERALKISALLQLDRYQQCLVVRKWFAENGLRMPSENILEKIFSNVIAAKADREPCIQVQNHQVRRYKNKLYLTSGRVASASKQIFPWPEAMKQMYLPDNGSLRIVPCADGIAVDSWQKAAVTVRYRRGGESIRLPGRTGRQRLKKLFQETAVPSWQRAVIPLIFLDEKLAAVADLWVSTEFISAQKNNAWKVLWEREK